MRPLVALILCASALLTWAVPARGGVYDVWSCADPSRLVYDDSYTFRLPAGWKSSGDRHYETAGTCQSGVPSTARRLSLAPLPEAGFVPANSEKRLTFSAPPGTLIKRVRVWWDLHLTTAGMRGGIRFTDECWAPCARGFGDAQTAPGNPFAAQRAVDLWPQLLRGQFELYLGCARSEACPPGFHFATDYLAVYAAVVTMEDDRAPTLAAPPSGSLFNAGTTLSGAQSFSVAAADEGSGIAAVALRVDGVEVQRWTTATPEKPCRAPYQDPQPCPASVTASYAFDTAALVDGRHALQVVAIDVAGNEVVSAPAQVDVANRTTPCTSSSAGDVQLNAGFGRRFKRRLVVPYGEAARLRGRVVSADGQALAGAAVQLLEQRLGAPAPRVRGTVLANGRGELRLRIPRGPSRRLWLASLAPGGRLICSEPVRLDVKAGVVLRLRPRRIRPDGQVRFRGRVLGGPSRRGVSVALYAVGRRGRDRVPVEILRTRTKGRFRFDYRFRRSFAPFTYRFRARVPRQKGYPYAPGWSNVALLRIVP